MLSTISEKDMVPALPASPESVTLCERQWEAEVHDKDTTTSSKVRDHLDFPASWQSFLEHNPGLNQGQLVECLKSTKKGLNDHCSRLHNKNIVHPASITAVTWLYETRIGSYLINRTPDTAYLQPKALIAKAMLWQAANVTFVLGPSSAGKSKFISLTCGNVQKRIKATRTQHNPESGEWRLDHQAKQDLQFIVTGAWLNGEYCPIIAVHSTSPKLLTAHALHVFAKRYRIGVKHVVCTLPFPPQRASLPGEENSGGVELLHLFKAIREFQSLRPKEVHVSYVTVGGPDWIDVKRYPISQLGHVFDHDKSAMELDERKPANQRVEFETSYLEAEVRCCLDSEDAVAAFRGPPVNPNPRA